MADKACNRCTNTLSTVIVTVAPTALGYFYGAAKGRSSRAIAESTLAVLRRQGTAAAVAEAVATGSAAATSSAPTKGRAADAGTDAGTGAATAPPFTSSVSPAKASSPTLSAATRTANPRGAVAEWFTSLALIMARAQAKGGGAALMSGASAPNTVLRELVRKNDSDGDGFLDTVCRKGGGPWGCVRDVCLYVCRTVKSLPLIVLEQPELLKPTRC